jgi:uridine kinase
MCVETSREAIVIGLSGVCRSGKGWVSDGLLQAVEATGKTATIISQDDYWFQACQVKVRGQNRTSEDEPECSNHEEFAAVIKESTTAYDIVIAEGFHLVHDPSVTALLNHIFLIELDRDEARQRRTQPRDGRQDPSPIKPEDFDDLLWPAHERYMKDKVAPLGARVVQLQSPADRTQRDELVHRIMHTAKLAEEPRRADESNGGTRMPLEAALDAWADCCPDGLTLPQASMPELLPTIVRALPGGTDQEGAAELINVLFVPGSQADSMPVFLSMLKARAGKIHFLDFWQAFSKAAHLLAGASQDQGLAVELETFRDSLLRLMDLQVTTAQVAVDEISAEAVAATAVAEAACASERMSVAPDFWREATGSLREAEGSARILSLEELTIIVLSWLHDAIIWESRLQDSASSSRQVATPPPQAPTKRRSKMPVLVHIYDVSQEDNIHNLNKWLAHKRSPLKFGGVFHAGIEVNGMEWSFGMSESETVPGVSCVAPKSHPMHRYRETVKLRSTRLSPEDVADILSKLIEEYPGDDYDLLRRNCCHFADDFAMRLGAGHLPGWVYRLARTGAIVDSALRAVGRKGLIIDGSSDED